MSRTSPIKAPTAIEMLWKEGFFRQRVTQADVAAKLEERELIFPRETLRMALTRAARDFLLREEKEARTVYVQRRPSNETAAPRSSDLIDDSLRNALGKPFAHTLRDLEFNYGKSGDCTAFLLRKILERLVYLALAKQGRESQIEDGSGSGNLIGLEAMVNVVAKEKVNGQTMLSPRTANEIRGVKFLGDASAHNPFIEIDMKTIVPQMPYIITAYKELARFLD